MTERYFYSPSLKGFYPLSLQLIYDVAQGGWPADAVEVSIETYNRLLSGQASGKVIATDNNSRPILAEPPAPTQEELVELAEIKKSSLLKKTNEVITPLQDAQELNIAFDGELAKLNAWKKYRVLLNRVNTAEAPDIVWPAPPAEPAI